MLRGLNNSFEQWCHAFVVMVGNFCHNLLFQWMLQQRTDHNLLKLTAKFDVFAAANCFEICNNKNFLALALHTKLPKWRLEVR